MRSQQVAQLRARAERLEAAVIRSGELLAKLHAQFGDEMGPATRQKVNEAIGHSHQIRNVVQARQAAADANTETAARSG
jgi:hypothetical protein